MMDADDGYILWTGIWKGVFIPSPPRTCTQLIIHIYISPWELERSVHSCGIMLTRELNCASIPADIIKMIESQPELAGQIRRVRGGYLKIQGTWMPYEVRAYFIAIICARLTFTSTGRTPTSSSVCRALTYLRTTRFDYVPL